MKDTEIVIWVIGILVTIQLAAMGVLFHLILNHIIKCAQMSNRLSTAEADLNRMKEDIGTHDTGMRGSIHKTANSYHQIEKRMYLLEKAGGLDMPDEEDR